MLFLMVFAGWSLAAIWTTLTPSLRTGSEDLSQKRAAVIKVAVARYRSHSGGAWPTTLDGLRTNTASLAACAVNASTRVLGGWCGPYIETVFQSDTSWKLDGYGTAFEYSSAGGTLKSCGRDRLCGGGGAADDWTFTL
jgi:hypothetical protein